MKPFELVTSFYGAPRYGYLDPTPFLAPFFALFFGICLTDAAYGIILLLGVSAAFRFMRPDMETKRALYFFLICSFSTVLCGILTGGWFGDAFQRLPFPALQKLRTALMVLDPVKKATQFMGFAIFLGAVQVFLGVLLRIVEDMRFRDWKSVFLKDIPSVLIQTSVFLLISGRLLKVFALGDSMVSLLLFIFGGSLAALVLYALVTEKSMLFKVFWAFFGVYGVLSGNSMADILSYVRLFALGLTSGLLALSINEIIFLIAKVSPWLLPLCAVLFIFLHMANLFLSVIGAFAHTCRLQYYEFFMKFMEDFFLYIF